MYYTRVNINADQPRGYIIHKVCGKYVFLGRAVDNILLCQVGTIAFQSATLPEETLRHTHQLFGYLATQEDVVLAYHTSDMNIIIDNNVSHLCDPKVRSRARKRFFLSNEADKPHNNSVVLNILHTFKHVISSETEAELAALFTVRKAVYICIIPKNGTQTAINTNPNIQYNGGVSNQWQCVTQTHKGDGHAFPLAQRQKIPRTV